MYEHPTDSWKLIANSVENSGSLHEIIVSEKVSAEIICSELNDSMELHILDNMVLVLANN